MGIKFLFYIVFLISFTTSVLSKAPKKPSGLTLQLLHRDSIESNNLTRIEKFRKIIERSKLRANQLMVSTASAYQPTYDHHPALRYEYLNYVVELGVGTPSTDPMDPYYLVLDTSAELTWLQCDGCVGCMVQRQPYFNPDDSSTYERLPCDHKLCKAYECNDNHCKFKEFDSPDVHVEGFMSKDAFSFPNDAGDNFTVLDGVVFGCAYGAVGFPFKDIPTYNINGVFGLGLGPRSFASQFAPQQRFAYCLANWQFGPPEYPSGQLLFGDDALLPVSGHVQMTPIVETDDRSYFLKLLDMQINNETLTFEEGIFARKHDANGSHGGFLIDSGAAISYFAPDVYYIVRQEFVDYMKTLNLKETIPPKELADLGLDLCWDFSNGTDISGLPSLTLNFQDHEHPDGKAKLIIDPYSVFFIEKDVDNPHICLGIVHNKGVDPDLNILGGKQQAGNKFSFDVQNKTLSWMFKACDLPPDAA